MTSLLKWVAWFWCCLTVALHIGAWFHKLDFQFEAVGLLVSLVFYLPVMSTWLVKSPMERGRRVTASWSLYPQWGRVLLYATGAYYALLFVAEFLFLFHALPGLSLSAMSVYIALSAALHFTFGNRSVLLTRAGMRATAGGSDAQRVGAARE